MARITLFILPVLLALPVHAEPVKEEVESKSGSHWVVETDTADITGEPAALASEARKNWKKACDDWKKEFRENNKESKIINLNCGTMTCSGDVGNKSCVSKANYKIKTRDDD